MADPRLSRVQARWRFLPPPDPGYVQSLSSLLREAMGSSRWKVPGVASQTAGRGHDSSALLARLLWNRGIRHPEAALAFLLPDSRTHDPYLMRGMAQAVVRLRQAMDQGHSIAIYGDYDVDGLTGAAILFGALQAVGASATVFIPHRYRDGYGLNMAALAELAHQGVRLLVTADCGITASREIAEARRLGLDVVVTDHHTIPPDLPESCVVLHPRQAGCPYPFKDLSGAGVAFKLAQGLLRSVMGQDRAIAVEEELVDLVALGTIADEVPLVGENRSLVRRGLERLNSRPRKGLRALMDSAGLRPGRLDTESVAYAIAPRLNAAGRMDHARPAFRLLCTDDPDEAARLTGELERLNRDRQASVGLALSVAYRDVQQRDSATAALVLVGPYPIGIAGLVATRLVETFYRPAIVIDDGRGAPGRGPYLRGSARSVRGLDLADALARCSHWLERFGGHAFAAGLTIHEERVEEFAAAFESLARESFKGELPVAETLIDAPLRMSHINWDLLTDLRWLEPFGQGNIPPLFYSRGLEVRSTRVIGRGHLRLTLRDRDASRRAILFRPSEPDSMALDGSPGDDGDGPVPAGLQPGSVIDAVYHVRLSEWEGTYSPELVLKDWRPGD